MGATTDGHGTDTDQQSTGQRCGGSETGISVSEMSATASQEAANQSLARRAVIYSRSNSMCDTKTCSKCGEVKGLGEFAKRSCNADGLDNKCKPCKSAYVKSLKAKNPAFAQKERERAAKYQKENAEHIAKQRAKYHAENKHERNTASRAWKAENPERNKLMQDEYRELHREESRGYARRWYWQHRGRALSKDAAERANLHEVYVRIALGLRKADTTPELIALKREQLAIKRMARELKKAATKPTGENE